MPDAALAAGRAATILAQQPHFLILEWPDGARRRFEALWLRDQAQGGAFRHGDNDQRLFDVADLPEDLSIATAEMRCDGALAVRFEPEGIDLAYDAAWLKAHASDSLRDAAWPASWDAAAMGEPIWHDYTAVTRDPAALYGWLDAIRRDGVALMRGAPVEPETVCRLASLFGYVRETNYGRLFDVRAEAKPTNMAFTGEGLGVHTDNPYRDPVPTLQLLHCLQADADGGGESLAVDGFEAARRLYERSPKDYDLLTRWRVPFRYRSGGVDLQARRRLIEADEAGRPIAVAYNNRSIAPFDLPADAMRPFYDAYRRFARILREPDLPLRFTLAPGDVFIVDNRRVLHGRGAYGAGARWLQGCYADIDSLLSQLRVMERDRDQGDRG
ncbi:MAG: TauD/TfdA family dioxygenase [Marivibrio sp.]|uniref:2-trimethylaminoethylphosphonate dioxygenase n=1 Tax=Marivibrio sp. TaxID=2039719 RepID=UPI0032EDDB57